MHGLVLGKFMPPHRGHLYLVEFAKNYCQDLTVVVGSLACEPIAGELRYRWMQELVAGANVLHLTDENPQLPHEHPDFWNIWKNSLQRLVGRPIDLVFASEDYGQRLALELGAQFVPCNGSRSLLPVSGSMIRDNPRKYWSYLPAPVRAHYCLRVSVFGPESTGKSTLTRELASHFQAPYVPEFARDWLEAKQGQVGLADMEVIARAQAASEDSLARQSPGLLFCDTDPLATTLWSEELFGQCPEVVERLAQGRHYSLTLLSDVDVPWVADVVRYRPENRDDFFGRCRRRLEEQNRPYRILSGSWEQRWQTALQSVQELTRAD